MSIQDIAGGAQIASGADPIVADLLASGDYTGAAWADIVGAEAAAMGRLPRPRSTAGITTTAGVTSPSTGSPACPACGVRIPAPPSFAS